MDRFRIVVTASPRSLFFKVVANFPYRHLERSQEILFADREMVYVRKSVEQPQQDVISLSPHAGLITVVQ